MAIKFSKTDDLDKLFEEFAVLPDPPQVTFPDVKKKVTAGEKEQKDSDKWVSSNSCQPVSFKLEQFFFQLWLKPFLLFWLEVSFQGQSMSISPPKKVYRALP